MNIDIGVRITPFTTKAGEQKFEVFLDNKLIRCFTLIELLGLGYAVEQNRAAFRPYMKELGW